MRVLITGGGGFIGSHAVVETLEAGHEVVVIDDCSNVAPPAPGAIFHLLWNASPKSSAPNMLKDSDKLKKLRNYESQKQRQFPARVHHRPWTDDPRDGGCWCGDALCRVEGSRRSSVKPLEYYRVNVGGTVNLLKVT